eukprot:10329585-Alexandrium_andersonii.AAC.1
MPGQTHAACVAKPPGQRPAAACSRRRPKGPQRREAALRRQGRGCRAAASARCGTARGLAVHVRRRRNRCAAGWPQQE